jgi:hypothetical protein
VFNHGISDDVVDDVAQAPIVQALIYPLLCPNIEVLRLVIIAADLIIAYIDGGIEAFGKGMFFCDNFGKISRPHRGRGQSTIQYYYVFLKHNKS